MRGKLWCDVSPCHAVTLPRVTLLCPHVTLSHRACIVPLSRDVTCPGLLNICALCDITITGTDNKFVLKYMWVQWFQLSISSLCSVSCYRGNKLIFSWEYHSYFVTPLVVAAAWLMAACGSGQEAQHYKCLNSFTIQQTSARADNKSSDNFRKSSLYRELL